MFKIEALKRVSFLKALKFQPFSWSVCSNPTRQSKNIEKKYKTHIKHVHNFIWYMFPTKCEELGTNHLTSLLVVTMPYTCCFLWLAYISRTSNDIFIFNMGLRFEGLFWERYTLKGQIVFEKHWRLQSWTPMKIDFRLIRRRTPKQISNYSALHQRKTPKVAHHPDV